MKNELESVCNLLIHVIELSHSGVPEDTLQAFKSNLLTIFQESIIGTSGTRTCSYERRFNWDIEIIQTRFGCLIHRWIEMAFQKIGIEEKIYRTYFPDMRIYITPNLVQFIIGVGNPKCTLYSSDSPDTPWLPTEEYQQLARLHFMSNNKVNIAERTYHYLQYTSRYRPWDGRILKLELNNINIDGYPIEDEESNDWYIDADMKTPEIIKQQQFIHGNFKDFCRSLRRNTLEYVTNRQCVDEYLHQINYDEPSELYKRSFEYIFYGENPPCRRNTEEPMDDTPTNQLNESPETEANQPQESPDTEADRAFYELMDIVNNLPDRPRI